MYRKSCCTVTSIDGSFLQNVSFFYVMGKALSGKLSCPVTGRVENLQKKMLTAVLAPEYLIFFFSTITHDIA